MLHGTTASRAVRRRVLSPPPFRRLVVTDDIKMKGLGTSVWNATVRSVQSGADLVLTSNKDDMYQTVCDMVDSLRAAVVAGDIPEARLRESVTRVIRHKLRYGVMTWDGTRPALGAVPEPPPAHRAVLQAADEVCVDGAARDHASVSYEAEVTACAMAQSG